MAFKIYFYFILFILTLTTNSKRNLLEEGEKSDDIIILHTNDVHCGIDDYIGYDGLMLYKKELQTKYNHVLLVDAGDHIQGGAVGLLSQGKDIIDIMNKLEYDVVTLGNHEFDYKLERLYNLSHEMNNEYICANFCFRKDKEAIFESYRIVPVGNIKIGFIGLVTLQTLTKTYLHSLVDKNGELIYDFLNGNKGNELYERVQQQINNLKNEDHVDYVIIISHFGYGGDALKEYTSKGLLENLSGVNAIIDGHTHLIYNSTWKDEDNKDIYISQAGTRLSNIGKLTIKTDGTITSEMLSEVPLFEGYTEYMTVKRDKNRYVDPEMNQFLEDIKASHGDEFKKVVGHTDFDLLGAGNEKEVMRFEENMLCDLVADSMKHYGNSDVAILNAGSIRNDLLKGDITYENILDVLPFSNKIIVLEIKGAEILNILEFGMRTLPGISSRFSQVSGIKFKVDDSIPSPVVVNDIESFVKVEGERRVYDVYIGNEKLDENKLYNLSVNDYMAEGGDGYAMLSKYEVTDDTTIMMSDACKDYTEIVLNGKIPDKYKTSQG
ncbi:MAG: bifunctional metallophosphatase/5'-nucleotidase, partial [Clostridia bacterium]|nr:bifunctional metallophosphatase/5'-nucleotidase [Clostridia bacterium]